MNPPIVREDLVRFYLTSLEHAVSDLRLKLQQHAGSYIATEAWKAHAQEELALLEYMAEKFRELLPQKGETNVGTPSTPEA